MDISGRRTREPTVRSLAMQQLLSSPRTVSTVSKVSSLTDTDCETFTVRLKKSCPSSLRIGVEKCEMIPHLIFTPALAYRLCYPKEVVL